MNIKFKIKSWNGLSIRIIALFATAMLVSYSPTLLRDFFGDTINKPDELGYRWHKGLMDEEWDWGYRHYLYFWMCVCLFFVQVARLWKWVESSDRDFTP